MKKLFNNMWKKLELDKLTKLQKSYIFITPIIMLILGLLTKDSWINILISVAGMWYVAFYAVVANKYSFLFALAYVSLYTFICLDNKIYLDALQNIILIPIYIASFIHWGKAKVSPRNMNAKQRIITGGITVIGIVALYALSILLKGNYSLLDASNTTFTMIAMVLGYYGFSENWACWTVNNLLSAFTFGLALATPTGSVAVFTMKILFLFNSLWGWYNFYKMGKTK